MSLSLSFFKFFPCFAFFFPALVFYGGEKVVTAAADYLVLTSNLIPEGERLTFFQCSYESPLHMIAHPWIDSVCRRGQHREW